MAVAGALIGGAIGAYGKRPEIPKFKRLDPTQIQRETIAGNIANFGQASQLAAKTNLFNADQLALLQERSLPGGASKITDNIMAMLRGEIPADVERAVLRSTAGGAFGRGTGGAQIGLRGQMLGLRETSRDIMAQGFSSALQWLQATTAPQFDVSAMFFTPQQRYEAAFNERNTEFQRDLLYEQVRAAPDPATAALGKEIDRFFNTAAQAGMMAAGGGMGGMGGMMG